MLLGDAIDRLEDELSRDHIVRSKRKTTNTLRLTILGVGAMNSPRYAPAGLLVEYGGNRVMIDGGPGAEPKKKIHLWLVSDERGELMREIRKLARARELEPVVAKYSLDDLSIEPRPVVHTVHKTYGYLIVACGKKIVWAPEFLIFPNWAKGADLMFAEAAGWNRPIRFRGGVGGHASVEQVARDAIKHKVKTLIFAHIGRPTIKAIDAGLQPLYGEFGKQGSVISSGSASSKLGKVFSARFRAIFAKAFPAWISSRALVRHFLLLCRAQALRSTVSKKQFGEKDRADPKRLSLSDLFTGVPQLNYREVRPRGSAKCVRCAGPA